MSPYFLSNRNKLEIWQETWKFLSPNIHSRRDTRLHRHTFKSWGSSLKTWASAIVIYFNTQWQLNSKNKDSSNNKVTGYMLDGLGLILSRDSSFSLFHHTETVFGTHSSTSLLHFSICMKLMSLECLLQRHKNMKIIKLGNKGDWRKIHPLSYHQLVTQASSVLGQFLLNIPDLH